VNAIVVEAALAGKRVARLKGGDGSVFGRAAEELAVLEAAAIPFEVVPGVTAASAASACTGIPLTHRELASSVAFVTGHECRTKGPKALDFEALARFPGTLVFYMGVTTAPEWSNELIRNGMPPETPAAVVRRASLPDQLEIETTVGKLATVLAPGALRPPAVVLIGQAIRSRTTRNWFAERPLFGKTVLVTRPEPQARSLASRLQRLGARVVQHAAIEIEPPADWRPVDDAIGRLPDFDWLVFSSSNGVSYFLDRVNTLGLDLRVLGGVKLAAIGPATEEELGRRGLRADLTPAEYRAEALAEKLQIGAENKRFLLLRASRGREVLAEQLRSAGGVVEQVIVYQSVDVNRADDSVRDELERGAIDWVTVTSSAIARSVARLYGDALRNTRLAAISPLTAGVLDDLGLAPEAIAAEYTTAGLVDALVIAEQRQ
ncbi:MAG: uroporphyrinogen-III synthase, partial [Planctomycetota bacterium]